MDTLPIFVHHRRTPLRALVWLDFFGGIFTLPHSGTGGKKALRASQGHKQQTRRGPQRPAERCPPVVDSTPDLSMGGGRFWYTDICPPVKDKALVF